MPTPTPAALVVAAPTLFRQGLLALLHDEWPRLLLAATADATQLPELTARRPFALVVLDGDLPGPHLPTLLAGLHRACPAQRLLLLTTGRPAPPPGVEPGGQAAGFCLRLPRHAPPRTLAAALAPWLDAAAAGGAALPPRAPAPPCAPGGFSPRELQVLRLVLDDLCNDEIADQLCLSVRTVESHRRTLLQKAGTRTAVGLAARALREGWIA